MKKSLLIILLLFFGLCFSQTEKDLLGKWVGSNGNGKVYVTFYPDGYISFNVTSMPEKDFIIPEGPHKGKKAKIKYKIDSSGTPFKVQLFISFHNGREIEESEFNKGLIEFTKKNEMLFYMDTDNTEPDKIDPSSPDTVLFVKENQL
ncbi:hypothetical protein F3J23_06015 [Chryseobacterium sp. Tr-659]|uniref:hypothetical protein n=1 Tax=Chryseobacterium sp. Tr-659 TaxID=2608340 RepID=UPI001422ED9E|nr:hypothetical protein [Chryseobacterium sp. Tr-659]NIF04993.1 hypothetical protein [Chryseobacterium sp. Tr-659]